MLLFFLALWLKVEDMVNTKTSLIFMINLTTDERILRMIGSRGIMDSGQCDPSFDGGGTILKGSCFKENGKLESSHKFFECLWSIWLIKLCFYFRMSAYFQRKINKRFWGLLFGFQLKFNKKGLCIRVSLFIFLNL